jgi:lipopolysaccharide transport system ATP-binding protein
MEVIKVENLYKQYRLGQVSTGSIAHDLNRWWHTVRGKEDPYEKITGVNNREDSGSNDYVWALQDINFSVKQGEVLGIIGRNGAGKSTLLKILSKVTSPTKGNIKVKGRIASLLEVGTGFHPELTGRENIFLNGAILGMTKSEIRSKFDEIVAFSGVEKYIDTPVKRYSSGMYVRLAFAVAAHLEPEILIVDEVLAVGDAEFQKKCLGKMKDVSGEGRTVLFVSHNMVSIQALCDRVLLMERGMIKIDDNCDFVINEYIKINSNALKQNFNYLSLEEAPGNEMVRILSMNVTPENPYLTEDVFIEIEILNTSHYDGLYIALDFLNNQDIIAFGTAVELNVTTGTSMKAKCKIPKQFLNDGIYTINCYVNSNTKALLYKLQEALAFDVKDEKRELGYLGKVNGVVRPILDWEKFQK